VREIEAAWKRSQADWALKILRRPGGKLKVPPAAPAKKIRSKATKLEVQRPAAIAGRDLPALFLQQIARSDPAGAPT
jgi:hypothetical protein